jgi:Uncharacterised nucleotidyltransferase
VPDTPLTDRHRRALAALRLDAVIVEAIDALTAGGAEPILLKGPVIAGWLYDSPGDRLYVDCDLLVAPDALQTAQDALRELGYAPDQVGRMGAARSWSRGDDAVDLHTTLIGVGVPPAEAWSVLSSDTELVAVGGTRTARALGEAARALHLATHVAQHEAVIEKPRRDLERGLAVISRETWVAAAALARRLDAEAAFAAGLRRVDGGAALLQTLDVAHRTTPVTTLLEVGAPPAALGVAQLAAVRSPRHLARELTRALLPPASYMRKTRPLARRGRVGLAAAHVQRWGHLARHLPGGVAAWRRAR